MESNRGSIRSRLMMAKIIAFVALLLASCVCGVSCGDGTETKHREQGLSDLPAVGTEESSAESAQDQQTPITDNARIGEADLNAIKVLFKQNFKRVRQIHKEVIDSISAIPKYEIQYKMVYEIVDKIFDILELQKVILKDVVDGESNDLSYLSTSNVKIDTFQATLDLLGNMVLFSNIVHKVPDKMHRMMKKAKPEWSLTARWAYDVLNKTKDLIDPSVFKMVNLAAQELRIIEREPNYQGLKNDKSKKNGKTEKAKRPKRKREPMITRVDL